MPKYFNSETEKGIINFQKRKNPEKKKKIFDYCIRPAFLKLIENTIFVYGFNSLENIDDLKNDCLSYLFECLYKFNPQKGAGFSYFNQVCKNWFLQEVKCHKKRIQQDIPINRELFEQSDDQKKFLVSHFEEDLMNMEFLKLLQEEMNSWVEKVKNKQEKRILDAVLVLFEKLDDIQMLNKKSVYIYLRDLSGFNTKQIATSLKKIKKRYIAFKKLYYEGEI